jgi:hypothetical protein
MKNTRISVGRSLRLGLALTALAGLNAAAAQDIGYRGPSLAGSGPSTGSPSVTESKPESKLWFNDGSWWGSLWSASALTFRIHRLDSATHDWIDTGVAVESRPDSHSDALWNGTKLYIASHEFATGGGSPGDPLLVLRYSYNTISNSYSLDAGFPVTIGDSSCETLVIDQDTTGTLWAVWKQDQRVHFTHTLGSDTSWSAPAVLPTNTSDLDVDDICSLVAFGNRIGVLWSDQVLNNYSFSSHVDGTPDTQWTAVELALAGESDDHIHLEADSAGRVFAAVKNAADQIKLLVRTGGVWTQTLVTTGAEGWTRAIVLLNEESRLVHTFATIGPTPAGGAIFTKTSSLDSLAFAPGQGTKVIQDGSGLVVNNATSTKQNLTAESGLVVLAANVSTTGHYWHHEVPGVPSGNGLQLALAPGVAGTQNVITVSGATPGAVIGFYAGMRLGTSVITRPQCPGGVEIELGSPFRRLGTAHANPSGVATLVVFAPAATGGKLFHFQAVEPVSCRASNRLDQVMLNARSGD